MLVLVFLDTEGKEHIVSIEDPRSEFLPIFNDDKKLKVGESLMHQGLQCIFDWIEFAIHNLSEEEVVLQV
jgi:hypothetical protein